MPPIISFQVFRESPCNITALLDVNRFSVIKCFLMIFFWIARLGEYARARRTLKLQKYYIRNSGVFATDLVL